MLSMVIKDFLQHKSFIGLCIIMKALNGILMIQKQMKFYNVWKLHRPRMSHGLLADNVDKTLASLLYSCRKDAVFSEVREQWASPEKDVRSWRAVSICGIAELLVYVRTVGPLVKIRDDFYSIQHFHYRVKYDHVSTKNPIVTSKKH